MRTLVISDLHIGARGERDVLQRPGALRSLLAALDSAQRLVLLGDTVELREGRPQAALAESLPILASIGATLGQGTPVVMVPGNHDRPLVRDWVREQVKAGSPIGDAAVVPLDASPALAAIAAALRPAELEVRYPGVDLGDGVWAHHGHYVDRQLAVSRTPGPPPSSAEAYEGAPVASVSRLTGDLSAWLPAPLAAAVERGARLAAGGLIRARPLVATLPGVGRLAPVNARTLDRQFRRSALPAMATVAEQLGVRPRHIVFGHTHRAGPLAGDDPSEWQHGGVSLWNTGSWVDEPLLLTGASPPHPYWPGGALWIDAGQITPVNLLA